MEKLYEANETVRGARNNDYITIDGEKYKVQSVTDTLLVRLQNAAGEIEEWGQAQLRLAVKRADSVTVDHVRDYSVKEVSSEAFHEQVLIFQHSDPSAAAFLTTPVDDDATFYLVDGKCAGFAIKDGELLSLFNNTAIKSLGERLIEHAISKGARRLFCFDTDLTDIYRRHGFVETERGEWDESKAPDNWDYETYGRPDVVWLDYQR